MWLKDGIQAFLFLKILAKDYAAYKIIKIILF